MASVEKVHAVNIKDIHRMSLKYHFLTCNTESHRAARAEFATLSMSPSSMRAQPPSNKLLVQRLVRNPFGLVLSVGDLIIVMISREFVVTVRMLLSNRKMA